MEVSVTEYLSWSAEQNDLVIRDLEIVLLEEWGGPRSPLALEYLKKTIIPDLMSCFKTNENLLDNPTFTEIIAWKLMNQFAYPKSIVHELAKDILRPVQKICTRYQVIDPKDPWRRIFRMWISGESLLRIAQRTGYPLDYLELLILRYKKLKMYLSEHKASSLECMRNSELKEFGFEQLGFLYQLQISLTQVPLFRESLILEQIIFDLGLPLEIPDFISLLEIILAHEGELQEAELFSLFRKATGDRRNDDVLTVIIENLISIHYVLKNKAGYLKLSEGSAQVISGFFLTKITDQLKQTLNLQDYHKAQQIINKQNPEVLVLLIKWMAENLLPEQTLELLTSNYKKINRRFDLIILDAVSPFEISFNFLFNALGDKDSLLRAKACEAIAHQRNKDAVFCLIQLLRDPVSDVKANAAFALGEIGSSVGKKELQRISEDYNESLNVREQARMALKKISDRN